MQVKIEGNWKNWNCLSFCQQVSYVLQVL